MHPLVAGQPTGLVEIPASWYIDDLPPMMFIKKAPNSHGWVDPKVVEQLWMDHFDYFYENYREEGFVFPMTIHPDVSGRPHVLKMHQRYFPKLFLFCFLDLRLSFLRERRKEKEVERWEKSVQGY